MPAAARARAERVGSDIGQHFEKILGHQPLRAIDNQRNRARRLVAPEELGHRVQRADRVLTRADGTAERAHHRSGWPIRHRSAGQPAALRPGTRGQLRRAARGSSSTSCADSASKSGADFGPPSSAHLRVDAVQRRRSPSADTPAAARSAPRAGISANAALIGASSGLTSSLPGCSCPVARSMSRRLNVPC